MKRLIITTLTVAALLMPAKAQDYQYSRYYNHDTGRLDYGRHDSGLGTGNMYYGIRIGPAFSFVNSDDPELDGDDWHTGLTVGALVGLPLSQSIPLYIEAGLQYTEKGGKQRRDSGKKKVYNLNYIEMPIVVKYIYPVTEHITLHPFFGGYLAYGINGRIKDYETRKTCQSFSDSKFQRFDGGLRLGCGIGYDLFYVDLSYDIGLSNICHDNFDSSKNGSLSLNFGVNF